MGRGDSARVVARLFPGHADLVLLLAESSWSREEPGDDAPT